MSIKDIEKQIAIQREEELKHKLESDYANEISMNQLNDKRNKFSKIWIEHILNLENEFISLAEAFSKIINYRLTATKLLSKELSSHSSSSFKSLFFPKDKTPKQIEPEIHAYFAGPHRNKITLKMQYNEPDILLFIGELEYKEIGQPGEYFTPARTIIYLTSTMHISKYDLNAAKKWLDIEFERYYNELKNKEMLKM